LALTALPGERKYPGRGRKLLLKEVQEGRTPGIGWTGMKKRA